MIIRKTYSISGLLFLTAIVAFCVYYIERKTNPPVPDLFRELISMIPIEGRPFLDDPARKDQLLEADNALAEKIPGAVLPKDVTSLYRLCGGQPWKTPSEAELFPMFSLNPIETAISDYKETCNLWEIHVADYEDSEFPNKWFDYRLFPFGWAPGTGTRYCVDIETGKIYNFNPDGGIGLTDFASISHLLSESIKFQHKEFER